MNKKDLQQIRELIREELASKSKCTVIEPEFETGKWYVDNNSYNIFYCTKTTEEGPWGYGIGTTQDWCDECNWCDNRQYHEYVKASNVFVEKILITEAKHRGFKKGSQVKDVIDGEIGLCGNNNFLWHYDENALTLDSERIFQDGIWAEIIDNKLEINGKEVKISKETNTIQIGCASDAIDSFENMISHLEHWGITQIIHPEINESVLVKDLKDLL